MLARIYAPVDKARSLADFPRLYHVLGILLEGLHSDVSLARVLAARLHLRVVLSLRRTAEIDGGISSEFVLYRSILR